jgi:flagellar biosynthesis protein FlhB
LPKRSCEVDWFYSNKFSLRNLITLLISTVAVVMTMFFWIYVSFEKKEMMIRKVQKSVQRFVNFLREFLGRLIFTMKLSLLGSVRGSR